MIRRPPRSTLDRSSAASDVYKRQIQDLPLNAKWIYITGENGIGKTILLQAIALGLTNYEENIKHLTKGCELTIGFCQNGKHFRNNVVEKYNEDFTNINHHFIGYGPVSYTHLRAHETVLDLVCRLLLEKKKGK